VQGEEEEEAPRKSQVWEEEEAKVQGNDLQVVWEEKSPLVAKVLGKSLLAARTRAPRKNFLVAEANQKVEASVQKKPEVKDGNEKRKEEGVHLLLLLLLQ
jgi:hypothetical protein